MTRLLRKSRFGPADLNLPEVQGFDCGPNRWDAEVATWIKSPSGDDSAVGAMEQFGTEVWLYRTEEGDLVGFGSWGEKLCSCPLPKGPKKLVSYIPYLGVRREFQGEPKGANRDDKFAYQILDDLIEESVARTTAKQDLFPVIVLSVDQENKKAIQFYKNRGFADAKSPHKDKRTGVVYDRMVLNIEPLVPPRQS